MAEWSSRYNIPIPLLEDSVDLRQLRSAAAALPPPATADDDDESSEEDKPVWQIKEHAMRIVLFNVRECRIISTFKNGPE